MNIPEGHNTVMPYLMMQDARGFIEFIKNVFAAQMTHESERDGVVGHCEARIGDSTLMFSASRDQWKPAAANLFVYVADADATYEKAISAGASAVTEMADQDYGRSGGVTDPFGNVWWITSAKISSPV